MLLYAQGEKFDAESPRPSRVEERSPVCAAILMIDILKP
jgi:hypothetical protein